MPHEADRTCAMLALWPAIERRLALYRRVVLATYPARERDFLRAMTSPRSCAARSDNAARS